MSQHNLQVGDFVADSSFGFIFRVEEIHRDEIVVSWECNPRIRKSFLPDALRVLGKKGVEMTAFNSGMFAERIRKEIEWSKSLWGLPKDYYGPEASKAKKPKKVASTSLAVDVAAFSLQLQAMSKEELERLVEKLKKESE